jgi:ADP-ribose pyrophosphatase
MATGLVSGETKHEADEFLDLEPMLLSRALELVEAGEIRDAKTALGLLYAAGFRAGH